MLLLNRGKDRAKHIFEKFSSQLLWGLHNR